MTESDYKNLSGCIALGIEKYSANDEAIINLINLKKKVFDGLRELEELKKSIEEDGKTDG